MCGCRCVVVSVSVRVCVYVRLDVSFSVGFSGSVYQCQWEGQCGSMGVNVRQWVSMSVNVRQWVSMGVNECQCVVCLCMWVVGFMCVYVVECMWISVWVS